MHKNLGELLCTLCTLYFRRCYTNNRKPQYIINFCYNPISNKNNTFSRRESAEFHLAVSLLLFAAFFSATALENLAVAIAVPSISLLVSESIILREYIEDVNFVLLVLDKHYIFMYNLIYEWCDNHKLSSQYPNPIGYLVFP